MFKLTAMISAFFFFSCSWLAEFTLPRLTHTGADFVLMPFLGYLALVLAAQLAARLPVGILSPARDK